MITETIRKALLAGVGIQERIRESIDDLVKKGELSQTQGAKIVKDWTEAAEKSTAEVNKTISELLEKALQKMNLPARDDVETLSKRVQSLSIRVKRLETKAEELEEKTEKEKEDIT
ncbi:MAG: phasin family protein [Nitrospiraceae bacterium]|nr:phasin family protein [Nitrospiraceae bacterium]